MFMMSQVGDVNIRHCFLLLIPLFMFLVCFLFTVSLLFLYYRCYWSCFGCDMTILIRTRHNHITGASRQDNYNLRITTYEAKHEG